MASYYVEHKGYSLVNIKNLKWQSHDNYKITMWFNSIIIIVLVLLLLLFTTFLMFVWSMYQQAYIIMWSHFTQYNILSTKSYVLCKVKLLGCFKLEMRRPLTLHSTTVLSLAGLCMCVNRKILLWTEQGNKIS